MNITFSSPQYLFFLFIISAAILVHFASIKAGRRKALRFANFDAIAKIKGVDIFSKNLVILTLSCIIFFLMVLALAGLTINRDLPTSSFSFVIALDASRSMEANDVAPNRLEAAKLTAKGFLDKLPTGTKAGVVSFSSVALIEQEMTDDKERLKKAVDGIKATSFGGTSIYETLILSANLLEGEDSKAIILLSDGQNNAGSLDEYIDYLTKQGVKVHTISIGTKQGGNTSYGISKVDEDSLKSIALNTGGQFFSADDRTSLDLSFNEILAVKNKNVSTSLSIYLLMAAMILFFVEYVLFSVNYRTFP